MNHKKLWIEGLVPAVFSPMHADGHLHLTQVARITEQLITEGVSALYVCGSTGEGPSLTREERMAVAEAYITASDGRLPVIVQVGHNSIAETRALAAHAAGAGAAAISAVPPSYFKPASLENLIDIMYEIMLGAPDLPFYYYHIPRLTAVELDMVAFLESGGPRLNNLVGVKYSAFTIYEMQSCLAVGDGRYNMLFGSDEMLLSGLVAGAHGAVGSTYNFAAPLFNRVVAAFACQDVGQAQRLQAQAVDMIRFMLRNGKANASLKAVMKMIGLDCGPVRLPQVALTAGEEAALRQGLEEMGFFDWGRC